jgi:hypothetical protein
MANSLRFSTSTSSRDKDRRLVQWEEDVMIRRWIQIANLDVRILNAITAIINGALHFGKANNTLHQESTRYTQIISSDSEADD